MLLAASAFAEAIPGPPLASSKTASSKSEGAGAFCPMPGSVGGHAAGFAAGVAIVAIAARRRA